MRPLRLVLVDDNTLLRGFLAEMCGAEPDLCLVGQAGGGDAAVAAVRRTRPDVVLLAADVASRPVDGLRAVAEGPSAPRVVVLGLHDHTPVVRRLLAAEGLFDRVDVSSERFDGNPAHSGVSLLRGDLA